MKPKRGVYFFIPFLISLIYNPIECNQCNRSTIISTSIIIVTSLSKPANSATVLGVISQTNTNNETDSSQIDSANEKSSLIEEKPPVQSNKYALIITGPARVLKELRPNSPILGMAHRGKHYSLITIGKSWCTIKYKNDKGWIERKNIEIVDEPSKSLVLKDLLLVAALIASIAIILTIIFFILNRRNIVKTEWFLTENKRKKIIIISNTEIQVPRFLTNTTTSLEKCFSELGFEIKKAPNSNTAMKLIYHYLSDAIIVDWQLGDNTQAVMEQLLSGRSDTTNTFVLFYNVSNPESIKKSEIIPNANYLGISFTDRELFNIITPLIITGEKKQHIRKSIEASALQGDLSEDGLSEIFQFIEIGKKTGSLLIEDEKPIGIVYFKDGIIIYAAGKHSIGKKAVLEILKLKEGQFQFVLDRHPKSPNCSIPTLEILMEWTKECDETSRNRLRTT